MSGELGREYQPPDKNTTCLPLWFSSHGTLARETSHTRADSEFHNCELINMCFLKKFVVIVT